MNKLRIVAVDDELLALQLIENFLKRIPEVELIATFRNPLLALAQIESLRPDVLLLDIEMPEMKGVDVVRQIPKETAVIFSTAYSEYAALAFELEAVDYLLKPFAFERFERSIQKVLEYLEWKGNQNIEAAQGFEEENKFLVIRADHKNVRIPVQEIQVLEAYGEYIKVHCKHSRYVTLERMKNMEELLDGKLFFRVHRSFIIRLDEVRGMEGYQLNLSNGMQIPVSREKKEEVAKLLFG
jgi:DNA-binding LytR/AlgR family response regulator